MGSNTTIDDKEVLALYAKTVSSAHIARMSALGLNFVASKREGVYFYDTAGKAFIDCYCSGGANVVGHRQPEIIQALRDAAKECDLGNFPMISKQKAALAKLLADIAPGNLKCVVFGVGRGESNDFAMKLARGATGRKEIISFSGAYHGQTGFALSASDNESRHAAFGPMIPYIRSVPLDTDSLRSNVSSKTAAVIIEPIQSDAGVVFPPNDLLSEARKACDRAGAALIIDEGQTAFGRTGKLFACEHSHVVPDILVMSKGMGGSVYPITAAVFTPKLNRFMLSHPLIHLSTFGGADIGCLTAIAAIAHIRENRLWDNAVERGKELLSGLKEIVARNPSALKEARGAGLLIGVETASAETAESFCRALAANGVIALPAPGNAAVVRFLPPLDIDEDEIAKILKAASASATAIS